MELYIYFNNLFVFKCVMYYRLYVISIIDVFEGEGNVL